MESRRSCATARTRSRNGWRGLGSSEPGGRAAIKGRAAGRAPNAGSMSSCFRRVSCATCSWGRGGRGCRTVELPEGILLLTRSTAPPVLARAPASSAPRRRSRSGSFECTGPGGAARASSPSSRTQRRPLLRIFSRTASTSAAVVPPRTTGGGELAQRERARSPKCQNSPGRDHTTCPVHRDATSMASQDVPAPEGPWSSAYPLLRRARRSGSIGAGRETRIGGVRGGRSAPRKDGKSATGR